MQIPLQPPQRRTLRPTPRLTRPRQPLNIRPIPSTPQQQHISKMIEFVISRLSDDFKQTDLVRFVVCNHSRRKKVAWAWVCGVGDAPEVPFCAAQLLTDNVIPEDFSYIPVFADFERCIAWTWLEMMQNKKGAK